ncbi:putative repeat protein (TIGR01451 family)/predicted secreted protein (Por secretion system target) [Flavobacterium croceum DSM 17960]|uniref:Putative repeat protein (TIGR01451 family)/predicted secreted protein (Por secretion system target) n=1 Tax=Flavobacterium croceum DSM 17960 TaxID=1121886 RepID=A0A2S4N4G9_9FLAO|nr:T9SS type A sorting domain-containing protein [Flavobacterium croceum]POS00585.1 putative repeat protein (TIGR01451 family)/predicted secreted protein (Por secretion system target) [Flavobacterium croceum DSM 17960]
MKIKTILFLLVFTTLCNAQIINIPNINFKAKLLEASSTNQIARDINGTYFKIDSNNNNEIEYTEADDVYELNISNLNSIQSVKISDITGLIHFSNLRKFHCIDNLLTNLDLTSFANLLAINCGFNQLTSLNISGLNQLEFLSCESNQIVNLDLSNKPNLVTLYCENNNISNLNLNELINLIYLTVSGNPISILDFSGIYNIEHLQCMYTNITNLDVSNQTNLDLIMCGENPSLEKIFMKNGKIESGLNLINLPNLKYVCVDDLQLTTIQNNINFSSGSLNCSVNTYCSFSPGGTYYTIQGQNKFDANNNGCDNNDIICPKLKYSITNGTDIGYLISNITGFYYIPVQAGTQTITPIIENPTYFNVSPITFNVSFPTAISPYNQDFCITANGFHNDLELMLIPINTAVPGFNAKYKLVFKNKGTTTQSGTINFTFDDSVLDFVSSNPNVSNQSTGSLNWNFINLLPFESREIDIILNLNSPTETPSLNSGDLLNSSATVNGQTDETPNDNIAILNQIVVNSYDPNDKTCLEGTTITTSMVGEYVHYLIRFENNGTANAQNIIVKDMIDINKFDINTLIPIKGSHNFETRISSINKVEFIFQNINLPFDDANNDGYVSFKIKTKPNLVVGNTFSNSANIYFDYNFPIVTNNYTTTIQNTLGLQENDFINNISVYPNPVKNILNFKAEDNISKVEVYDISGRILSSNSVSENKIDLSELKTGNYILKIYIEKGIMKTKIIKE